MARPPKIPYLERIGMKFNMLTILEISGFKDYKGSRKAMCLVRCDCGKEATLLLDTVVSLKQISCGCYRKKNKNSAFRDAYIRYRNGANQRDYLFSLTEQEFLELTQSDCHYCDSPPSILKETYGDTYVYNGIDRKDNAIGYEFANCLPCCTICNRAKNDMKYDDFVAWIWRMRTGAKGTNEGATLFLQAQK